MHLGNLLTVKQIVAEAPALTEAGLRQLIFRAEQVGLSSAIHRIGRKVLIDREGLLRWICEPRTSAAAGCKGSVKKHLNSPGDETAAAATEKGGSL